MQAQSTGKIPSHFCISQQEYKLYTLINAYRAKIALEEIPLSRSLCYVAKTHAADLAAHFPMGENCNMHSWSDKGSWKPFCFPADQNRKNDIKDKAKEMTDYPAKAWEITYWENTSLDLAFVLEFWNSISYTADMIGNTNKWADKDWKSIGIGIQDGYVLVWFGQAEDVEISTTICETGERIMNKSIPNEVIVPVVNNEADGAGHSYYIIIGSFKQKKDAQTAVDSYHQMGYPDASIVESDARIRVAIDQFQSQEKADEALIKYRNKFQGAWVFSK
ncbi:MAG: hypothetical protein GQ527_09020 [Bacteroidales bacterium]|nr:hypothetical protein [Bacteroidales bacterium]